MARKFLDDGTNDVFDRFARHDPLLDLAPWELHIPVSPRAIDQWRKEVPHHGGSQYGKILERDIRLAEECNRHGCRMIVSFGA